MKKIAKFTSAVLTCLLLAGCAQTAPPSSEGGSTASASGDTAQVTLKLLVPYTPFDAKTDNAVLELEKGTGYDIEFDTLPEKNSMDKLNLIFSSGKVDYDYIRLGNGEIEKSLFVTYAKKGLLADLTDQVGNYQNIGKIDPEAFEALKYDEKLYGIPSTGMPYSDTSNFIRMDWLEKLNLQVPTTAEELYTVLKAFKEKDPGELGENNIPFSATPGVILPSVSQSFGILYEYEVRDGDIADMRLRPEYKDYLTFMNKLYSEKILDPDMPVNTGSKLLEKCASGRVGFYAGGTDQARDLLIAKRKENQDGTYFKAMGPLKDQNGGQRSRSLEGLFAISIIPASSEKAEDVLKYMDNYLSPEVFESIIHGVKDVDYTEENGERKPILPAFDKNRGNMYALFPVQNGEQYFPLWKLRTKKTEEAGMYFQQVFDETGEFLETGVLAFAPSFDSVSEKVKLVQEYALQESTKFIAGARSLDDFDAFVQEMKGKGADEIVGTYNEWYKNK